jgi:hypothetical protein
MRRRNGVRDFSGRWHSEPSSPVGLKPRPLGGWALEQSRWHSFECWRLFAYLTACGGGIAPANSHLKVRIKTFATNNNWCDACGEEFREYENPNDDRYLLCGLVSGMFRVSQNSKHAQHSSRRRGQHQHRSGHGRTLERGERKTPVERASNRRL